MDEERRSQAEGAEEGAGIAPTPLDGPLAPALLLLLAVRTFVRGLRERRAGR